MQLLDQLEKDYQTIYPDDPPVLEEGFEEALRKVAGFLKMNRKE